jgi:hypothetical protein
VRSSFQRWNSFNKLRGTGHDFLSPAFFIYQLLPVTTAIPRNDIQLSKIFAEFFIFLIDLLVYSALGVDQNWFTQKLTGAKILQTFVTPPQCIYQRWVETSRCIHHRGVLPLCLTPSFPLSLYHSFCSSLRSSTNAEDQSMIGLSFFSKRHTSTTYNFNCEYFCNQIMKVSSSFHPFFIPRVGENLTFSRSYIDQLPEGKKKWSDFCSIVSKSL